MEGKQYKCIYVDGVFDLFHVGHLNMLKRCKSMCELLIVGVASDEDMEKIKRRPIINLEMRVEMIRACKYVDHVVSAGPCDGISEAFLEEHNIDMVVHGNDYSDENIQKYYGVPSRLNKFKTIAYTPSISTTEIINKIKITHK